MKISSILAPMPSKVIFFCRFFRSLKNVSHSFAIIHVYTHVKQEHQRCSLIHTLAHLPDRSLQHNRAMVLLLHALLTRRCRQNRWHGFH